MINFKMFPFYGGFLGLLRVRLMARGPLAARLQKMACGLPRDITITLFNTKSIDIITYT